MVSIDLFHGLNSLVVERWRVLSNLTYSRDVSTGFEANNEKKLRATSAFCFLPPFCRGKLLVLGSAHGFLQLCLAGLPLELDPPST